MSTDEKPELPELPELNDPGHANVADFADLERVLDFAALERRVLAHLLGVYKGRVVVMSTLTGRPTLLGVADHEPLHLERVHQRKGFGHPYAIPTLEQAMMRGEQDLPARGLAFEFKQRQQWLDSLRKKKR